MAFERFTLGGRAFRPKASIRATGQIGLSAGCVTRFSLENTPYAVLFFDRESRKIGIKPTDNPEEERVLKLAVRAGSGTVSARSFLDYYRTDYTKTRNFDAQFDEREGLIIIELK